MSFAANIVSSPNLFALLFAEDLEFDFYLEDLTSLKMPKQRTKRIRTDTRDIRMIIKS